MTDIILPLLFLPVILWIRSLEKRIDKIEKKDETKKEAR